MSEAATTPETGVDAVITTDDDIDTEAFDRQEAPAEDDAETDPAEPTGQGEEGEQSEEEKAKLATEADTVEVEAEDGTKHRIPKALERAFLREADYTRKTQELAAQRRAVESDRSTWETQKAESLAALPEEHAKIAIIDHRIVTTKAQFDQLHDIDWPAFRASAATDDAMKLEYEKLRPAYERLRDDLADLTTERGEATKDLSTKEQTRLEGQRTASAEASAKAWQETEAALADEKTGIPGWSPEKAKQLASVAVNEFGVKAEELQAMHDPRQWKLLHTLQSTRDELSKAQTALKQKTTADNHGKAQQSTPAAAVKGSGASARDPATPRGDGLATGPWMERRNAQVAKKRA